MQGSERVGTMIDVYNNYEPIKMKRYEIINKKQF